MKGIDTERLRLEPLVCGHAKEMYRGLVSKELYEFIADIPPTSIKTLEQRYRGLEQRQSPDGSEIWLNWAVQVIEDLRLIGYVQSTISQSDVQIGYVFFREAWGFGYGIEAVDAVLKYLDETYSCPEIRATVDTKNAR